VPPWAWPVVVALGFVAFWVWLVWLMAHFTGWTNLARYYRTTQPFHGTRHHFRSGKLGWSNYGGCLTVGTNAEGLYLAVFPLFRPGHPPLFVPWSEVRAKFVKVWIFSQLELRFERFPLVSIRFPSRLGRQIAADAMQSWGNEG
jgi:hypothetical protein